jgi:hypothetical protein
MIKANELRMGNVIEDINGKRFVVDANIISIVAELESKPALNDGEGIRFLRGMPLTPEILEKAGFEFIDMADMGAWIGIKISDDIALNWIQSFTNNAGINKSYYSIWIGEYNTKIQYLHQLQNLYFALTGEELTVKF